jgi:photosystem II stability/assembly factor-like uncharacterized protein
MKWTQFDHPKTIYALAAGASGDCFAATNVGLWRWQARDGRWQCVAPQFESVMLSAVCVHDKAILIGASGEIAFSNDAGKTWTISSTPVRSHVLALAMSPIFNVDKTAFAATQQDGVLRSDDGGATWHAWNFGLLDLCVNALKISPKFIDDGIVFAGTDNGVFISENGGRAWREFGLVADALPIAALDMDTERRIYAATDGAGLWLAEISNATWKQEKRFHTSSVNALVVDPKGTIVATPEGIYSKRDSSRWEKIDALGDAVCLAITRNNLFVGTSEQGMWLKTL